MRHPNRLWAPWRSWSNRGKNHPGWVGADDEGQLDDCRQFCAGILVQTAARVSLSEGIDLLSQHLNRSRKIGWANTVQPQICRGELLLGLIHRPSTGPSKLNLDARCRRPGMTSEDILGPAYGGLDKGGLAGSAPPLRLAAQPLTPEFEEAC